MLTLSDQAVQILVVGTLDAQVATTDIVDGLIVDHEAAIRVLESGMSGQDGVVGLNNRSCDLGSGVDTEFEFALLAIVDRQTLHQQGTEARSSTAAERVEDKETLQTSAVVCHAANLVEDLVNEFLAHGIVTTSIVIGRIFLASDHVLGMKKTAVGASADLIHDIGLEIAVDGTRDVFALA